MAVEVAEGGNPLKFTAIIDYSNADKALDSFYKKMGDKAREHEKSMSASDALSSAVKRQEEATRRQNDLLQKMSAQYRSTMSEAVSAFDAMDRGSQRNYHNLVSLQQESKRLTQAQRDLDKSFKSGSISQLQYIEGTRALSLQQNAVKQRISETNNAIRQQERAERAAVSSIAEKTARLTQLRQQYNQLSEAQRNNINVGGKLREEYKKISKEVEGLNTQLTGVKGGSNGIGSVFNNLQGVAGALGIAFSAQQLVSFGHELFNIAKQAEGVELAFARIGDPTALNRLREATRGTVSDLDLMTQAVRADKFRIPMDVLAKGLEFARRRANETGQSVDYLTESFVNGLGRESKLILDNLGISAKELSEEVERTGNFMKAVSNIIDRELSKGGPVIDMLVDKSDRLATKWDNIKKHISDALRSWFRFGAGGPSAEGIEKQVISLNKAYEGFERRTSEQQKRVINQLQSDLDFEKKRANSISKQIERESIAKYGNVDAAYVATMSQQRGLDKSLEKINALEATLKKFKATNDDLEKQHRQKKGIFSLEELEQKLESKQTELKQSVNKKEQATLRAEIKQLEEQISAISGKGGKGKSDVQKKAEQLKKQIEKDTEEYNKLLKEIGSIGGKFSDEIITREQQEINSVISDYDKLIEKAKEYNATTKATDKKIDISKIESEKGLAVNRVIARQEKEEAKKKAEEQEKIAKESYEKMLKLSANLYSEEKAIREKYQQAYKALEENKTKITEQEFEARKNALSKGLKEELSKLFMGDLQESSDWGDVFERIMQKSSSEAQIIITELKNKLKKLLNEGKITIKEYEKAVNDIKNVEVSISTNGRGFNELKQAIKLFKEAKGMEKQSRLGELGQVANSYFQSSLDSLHDIGEIFDQLGIGSERFKENFADTVELLGNAGNLAASIMSGDVMGMIQNGIKTLSSVFKLFSKDKGLERQIKAYQKQLDELGVTYNKLQYLINNSVGESIYSDSKKAIENLKQQQRLLQQSLKAEEEKKKTDQEKVKAYKKEIESISYQIKELEKSIVENLVQTTFKQLADELTNALVSAFEAGENAVDSLDKVFDNFIKKALVNSLKLKMIEPIVNEMVSRVADYMNANNNSLVGFDFESWKKKIEGASENFTKILEESYLKLGLDKDSASTDSSLKSEGIERISEHTGTEILGTFRAGLDIWKRQYNVLEDIKSNNMNLVMVANNQLAQLSAIQTNTANTVTELKLAVIELKGIKERLR